MMSEIADVPEQHDARGQLMRGIELDIHSRRAGAVVIVRVIRACIEVFVGDAEEAFGVLITRPACRTRKEKSCGADLPGSAFVQRMRIAAIDLASEPGHLGIETDGGGEAADEDSAGVLIVESALERGLPIAQRLTAITVVREECYMT